MTKSKLYVELHCVIWKNNKGQEHREDGPAVEYIDGTKSWLLNGLLHRPDGPAIVCENSYSYWYLNGLLHREDGPAIVYKSSYSYWYLNGHEYSEEVYVNKLSKIQNQGNT